MRLLALDTSTKVTGVCLYRLDSPDAPGALSGRLEGLVEEAQERSHAEEVFRLVEKLLAKTGIKKQEIDGFACCIGPGSFTGLRIGITIAKTMAQFTKRSLFGISTLQSLLYGSLLEVEEGGRLHLAEAEMGPEVLQVPLLDARSNRIFASAGILREEEWQELLPESLRYEEDFQKELEGLQEKFALPKLRWVGSALSKHPALKERTDFFSRVTSEEAEHSAVLGCAFLAGQRALRGKGDDPLDLRPNYLRKSQAEMDFRGGRT